MIIHELSRKVEILQDRLQQLKKELKAAKIAFTEASRNTRITEEAQAIIQLVAKETQDQIRFQITELGSLALQTVFEDGVQLDLQFEEQKGKTLANIDFLQPFPGGGLRTDPLTADSGGACDLASEALRDGLWCAKIPRTRPVMFRDEPFKNINDPSREMQQRASEVVKMISDRLGVQFIIVTMLPELAEVADKVFEIK